MLWFLNFFFQDIVDTEFGAKPGCECVGRGCENIGTTYMASGNASDCEISRLSKTLSFEFEGNNTYTRLKDYIDDDEYNVENKREYVIKYR